MIVRFKITKVYIQLQNLFVLQINQEKIQFIFLLLY